MADNPLISQITLPGGQVYDIKDAAARSAIETISGLDAINFKGVSTTALTDGGTENPTVGGETITTKKTGDLYFYGVAEFIWDGAKWVELGDLSSLGDLAYKDNGTVVPTGTVTAEFTGSALELSVSGTPAGTISAAAPAGSEVATYTPAGTMTDPTISVASAGATASVDVIANIGSAPSATMPTLEMAVATGTENLAITWTTGSYNAGTWPTTTAVEVKTGDAAYSASGTAFAGTGTMLTFSGSSLTSTGSATPSGSVSATFTGNPSGDAVVFGNNA